MFEFNGMHVRMVITTLVFIAMFAVVGAEFW